MKTIKDFEIQIAALAMKPKGALTLEDVFQKFNEIRKGSDEKDRDAYLKLWEFLEPETISLDWPEYDYKPEQSLQKRCVLLVEKVLGEMKGQYPDKVGFPTSNDWDHLVQHGKLGLMSVLFSIEKSNPNTVIKDIAPMIEKFMDEIDQSFDNLLISEHRSAISKAFSIKDDESLSFKEFIYGRLQPFSLMRSLYLEESCAKLKPLQWWVQYERYIPNLPE